MNRWVGLPALLPPAPLALYVALVQTAPPRVFPGVPEPSGVTRATPARDAGSLDDFLDATQIQHTIGGR